MSFMADDLDELAKTIQKLALADERRNSLAQYRDRQMAEAKAAGVTWARLQEVTGLSLRGAQMAVERARAAEKS